MFFCIPAGQNCWVTTSEQAQSLFTLLNSRVGPSSPQKFRGCQGGAYRHCPALQSHKKEMSMKLAILAMLVTALIAASPNAFAQQSSGKTTGQAMQDKSATKASHARKHEGKTVGAKPSTPDTDNTSVPGASINKDDTVPGSK